MKRKQIALALALSLLCGWAWAGQGWQVIIQNNTNSTLTMVQAGHTCWYWNNIKETNSIPPKTQIAFYTEADNSGSCSGAKSIAGVNLVGNGPDVHIEFKGGAGDFGSTIKTIRRCGNDHQYVGVNRDLYPGNGYTVDCQPGDEEWATITAYPM